MIWLLPLAIVGAVVIYNKRKDPPPPRPPTILERNLRRLREELSEAKEPKIAIIGQPGAGKSSLLKGMTKGRVRPGPKIGIETDATDWSKISDCTLISRFSDLIFVDVPGYDTEAHPANVFEYEFPLLDFDKIIFVLKGKLRAADEMLIRMATHGGVDFTIARSFADSLDVEDRAAITKDLAGRLGVEESSIQFFSNRKKEGISELMTIVTAAA